MHEVDAAWAAGLFEGEGCITAQRRNGQFMRPLLSLQMTDADIVHRFHVIVGVGNVRIQESPHRKYKRIWQWQSGAIDDVRHVIRLFSPWLGERRLTRAQEYLLAYENAPVRRVSKTHCPHGHEFTSDNTRFYDGARRCVTCHRSQHLLTKRGVHARQ